MRSAQVIFRHGEVEVELGCSQMSGPWHLSDERLIAGPLRQKETVCADAAWSQEKAVSALLVATPRLSVSGRVMTLRSSGHEAELNRVEAKNLASGVE